MKNWLAVRERVDQQFRSAKLARAFTELTVADGLIVDLASGTGANVRYLAPMLGGRQPWLCVDRDASALSQFKPVLPVDVAEAPLNGDVVVQFPSAFLESDRSWRQQQLDLAVSWPDLEPQLRVAVTTSAFLDLASATWLDRLVDFCAKRTLLAAMTFCGPIEWNPRNEYDAEIERGILEYKRRDHGLGYALGPEAAEYLVQKLRDAGRRVWTERSDWLLGPEHAEMLPVWIAGTAARVRSFGTPLPIDDWERIRFEQQANGQLSCRVGHVDLLASSGK